MISTYNITQDNNPEATISTSRTVENWKLVLILYQWRNRQHIFSGCVYTIPAEILSTHRPGRYVPILFPLVNCQHMLLEGVCVYNSKCEPVNTFPQKACACTIPAENLSTPSVGRRVRILFQQSLQTHSLGRRVPVLFQPRICQHLLSRGISEFGFFCCRCLLIYFSCPGRTQQPDSTLREGHKSITTYLTTVVPTASVL
jgi:hypothetical protein